MARRPKSPNSQSLIQNHGAAIPDPIAFGADFVLAADIRLGDRVRVERAHLNNEESWVGRQGTVVAVDWQDELPVWLLPVQLDGEPLPVVFHARSLRVMDLVERVGELDRPEAAVTKPTKPVPDTIRGKPVAFVSHNTPFVAFQPRSRGKCVICRRTIQPRAVAYKPAKNNLGYYADAKVCGACGGILANNHP